MCRVKIQQKIKIYINWKENFRIRFPVFFFIFLVFVNFSPDKFRKECRCSGCSEKKVPEIGVNSSEDWSLGTEESHFVFQFYILKLTKYTQHQHERQIKTSHRSREFSSSIHIFSSFLQIGLPPSTASFSEEKAASVRAHIQQNLDTIKEAGYDVEVVFADVRGASHMITSLEGKKWDGIVIGFGVRGNPEMTVLFEEIVDAVRKHAPQAKLMFNSSPETSLDAIKRHFQQ